MYLIGSGSFGNIYHHRTRGTVIKVSKYSSDLDTRIVSISEIDIVFRLRCPNLIRGLGIETQHHFALELEKLTGDYFDIADAKFPYNQVKKKLFFDYVKGLKFLHSCGYVHLDLKPENLMYTGNLNTGQVTGKIIDFGWSIISSDRRSHTRKGTLT